MLDAPATPERICFAARRIGAPGFGAAEYGSAEYGSGEGDNPA
jgi:hypothetical protein